LKSVDSRILAVIACLLWATAFAWVKTGLESMPPLLFAGIRFMAAGVIVSLLNLKKGFWRQIAAHWPTVLLVGFLQTFVLYSLFFYSLTMMRASTGAIVNGVGPLVVALTAHFSLKGNRLSRGQMICLFTGAAGVVLVALSGSGGLSGGDTSEIRGILLMLGGILGSAVASVVVAGSAESLDSFVLNGGQLIAGSAGLLLAAVLGGERPYNGMPGTEFWIALAWLIFVTGGGFSIWYYLLKVRKEPLSRMAVWRFLIPLGGAVISWIIIGSDKPDPLSLGGMALTALSITIFYKIPARGDAGVVLKPEEP